MARKKLEWTDAQRRLIIDGIGRCDAQFPQDNDRFLDAVIDEIGAVTGRVYGASTYDKLIRTMPESMGITRRPSLTTIQKAIARAQDTLRSATHDDNATTKPDVGLSREVMAPLLREALAPIHTLLAALASTQAAPSQPGPDVQSTLELELTRAALTDVHSRLRQRDEEIAALRVELGKAIAERDLASTRVAGLLDGLRETFQTTGVEVVRLVESAKRLTGTEQYLKLQADSVRQQAMAETERLRDRTKSLEARVDQLMIENDQYRRALTARRQSEN
ncbi:hypothetical protein KDW40_01790 [Burkholderia cenocepacia]|uniref:hypothetical protein n=1 Tax=Burkholderia cenocepacia TaxID=95486 RepID=UPI001BA3F8BB|nr:hypothetical protein [Burkholderia cenocepacia]MBR8043169.1 hypothetical protein [Burkholderia cenocepacia]MBR8324461.1 hypothetical protein [Burkholderia cenocepacia]